MKQFFYILLIALAAVSCRKDEPKPNEFPETGIFVKAINQSGDNRKSTTVTLHWNGQDKDGYISFYEISINNAEWRKVYVQDSTFVFEITTGNDTVDIDFKVRATDDKNATDPTPAQLFIPIKNTPPIARFDYNTLPADTVPIVFSLLWEISDVDGLGNLDSVFVKLNDGDWFGFSKNVSFATIVSQSPGTAGVVNADVYRDFTAIKLSKAMKGLRMDDFNRAYVRVRDISGSYSDTDSTGLFYVKKKNSNMLVVDTYNDNTIADSVYKYKFDALGITYDKIDMVSNSGKYIPKFWNPTFGLYLAMYSKVFWYSDNKLFVGSTQNATTGIMLLESAASEIVKYLNNNGKILITTYLPTTIKNTSPIFSFSPMESISEKVGNEQARIGKDTIVTPTASFQANYQGLKSSGIISSVFPFTAKPSVEVMYDVNLIKVNNWQGANNIIAKTNNANGKTNQVFSVVELHKLNADTQNLTNFFDRVLNNEFNW